ncbi:nucleotide sugar dehydratase [Streptococcus cristatus]|uniref:Nucleotide sugar dehydratase n=2 Tax=Streptococcus cristatus TaxID=45634 RepID=A0A512ACF9_STRCR|nr:nucleotide sugar dehydratase [Streptococcus cristatus AS 1.3089]GEN97393.1 nucleotide sugar dehydratase [Streptococcus cristatus]SQI49936.1 nucleotide sugar dehydratase [Streptococcus cristatus]
MKNSIIDEDIKHLVSSSSILEMLNKETFLITGATGLLGNQIVRTLLEVNRQKNVQIRVLAVVRNIQKAYKQFSDLLENSSLVLLEADILSEINIDEPIDYIIHGASVTDSASFVTTPVDTIRTAMTGTENMLELARKHPIKGFLYLSSLEVYGITDPDLDTILETDSGYLDSMSVRSSYSESKRMAECLCVAYLKQYQVPIRVARLTQTFGPGVSYLDNRVFAQFARSVIEGKDIVLRTLGETVRSYCYTMDAVNALFYILLKGISGEAYNVANKTTAISIRNMAELVLELDRQNKAKLIFDIVENPEQIGYNPVMKIRLDTSKLESLGWKAEVGLADMYRRLISSMKSQCL